MMFKSILLISVLAGAVSFSADAGKKKDLVEKYPALAPYFKICIEGTDRVLAAAEGAEVKVAPAFTGAPEQLWRIEQLTDGSYRIMPKSVPGGDCGYVLTSIADSTPTLAEFDPDNDNCKWNFRMLNLN